MNGQDASECGRLHLMGRSDLTFKWDEKRLGMQRKGEKSRRRVNNLLVCAEVQAMLHRVLPCCYVNVMSL